MSKVLAELNINSELGVAAAIEARRLSEKYDKDFFDCDDLVKIMGVGKNNIRQLLNSESFPTAEIGNRKVVSVIAFALWSIKQLNPSL
ncbi:MAG: hypothetical protein FWG94_03575 [Oscillospiraceae bacterium]|nr:hypothetical protein [Oscillospiraceae bacterium]